MQQSDGGQPAQGQLIEVKVSRRSRETADVASIELASANGDALPPFTAGAHIDMYLPNGTVRQYSMCGAPGETEVYQFGVLLSNQSRGGGRAAHALKVGESLRISPPRNAFPLVEAATHSVLVAGGIGITPLMAMAYRLNEINAAFEMHCCARSKLTAAFQKRLSKATFAANVRWHFDNADLRTSFDADRDLPEPGAGTHLYVCGAGGFIDHVLEGARRLAWAPDNIHVELFGTALPMFSDDKAFHLVATRSGKTVKVQPGRSIAQVLKEAGVSVSVSCEQGICGTCLVRVVSGVPDHRDRYQSEQEHRSNTAVALCCSRSRTDVLEVDI